MKKIFSFVSALFLSATLFAQAGETELFVAANARVDHTWGQFENPEATWNATTGTFTVTIVQQAEWQWGNQVFLATGITTLDVTKEYQVSFDIVASTADCGEVTFKAFDDNQIAMANQNIAVTDQVQTWTSEWTKPSAEATNGLMVWDFGWDPAQTVTITNISIKERDAQALANAESVDLGLPSGTKWATFNVGATTPEGYGDYFAWGETEPYYSSQDPITWKTGKETGYAWQSYCGQSSFSEWNPAPYDATTNILKPEFDAATANWGSDWRMPTKADFDELIANCTWTWTEDYNGTGIKGYIVTSKATGNTNSIFLPASGRRYNSSFEAVGSGGYYWSSSRFSNNLSSAYGLYFASGSKNLSNFNRYLGHSVRPVTTKLIVPGPKVDDQFVDATSVLKFEVTAVGDTNTVKVIKNNYTDTSYTVPDTVKYLDVDFAVTEIGANAFCECKSLQSVTLSEGLITIGEQAFFGCTALQTITIPAGVISLGMGAFAECAGLTSVTFLGNACQDAIGEDAFSGVGADAPALLTLHGTWAKENQPDEDGNWYGGKFELSEDPSALPTLFDDGVKANKFLYNGQLIIRKDGKTYNAMGAEVTK